jgi:hypothetical protein
MSSYSNKGFSTRSEDILSLNSAKSDEKSFSFTHSEVILTNFEKPSEKMIDVIERQQWTNGIEFLFSCVSMSVGLG